MLDSDVVKKLTAYDLFDETHKIAQGAGHDLLILGAAPFVLAKAISKSRSISDRIGTAKRLGEAIKLCVVLEPTEQETSLAAALEDAAQRSGFPFDAGESLLVAILATRTGHSLATGDKRALGVLPTLASGAGILVELQARIACLEQVISSVLKSFPDSQPASRICSEPLADTAISICFGCTAGSFLAETALAALSSYTAHLRAQCTPLLVDGDDLSALLL